MQEGGENLATIGMAYNCPVLKDRAIVHYPDSHLIFNLKIQHDILWICLTERLLMGC